MKTCWLIAHTLLEESISAHKWTPLAMKWVTFVRQKPGIEVKLIARWATLPCEWHVCEDEYVHGCVLEI